MRDIWSYWTTSRSSIRCSYYLCSILRVGRQTKEASFVKFHSHDEISFSNIWHWGELLMLLQHRIFYGSWREYISKKYQRYCYRPWNFCIWDFQVLCQKWNWAYDFDPGSGILCSWVTDWFSYNFPTSNLRLRRIQGCLSISLSLLAWYLCGD